MSAPDPKEIIIPAQSAWIGSDHPFDLHEVYLCFRRAFELERAPGAAELWITADSRYKLWVNGALAGRGPARCYPHAQAVDRVDVAASLRPGRNVIAVQVYQPGYSHFAYVHRAATGLLAWLRCDGEPLLATDPSWHVRRDRSFASSVPRVSIYGSGVEERDLALDEPWRELSYDDAGWAAARVVSPAEGGLWASLQPRALPPLAERFAPLALVAARHGRYPAALDADAHLALREGWAQAEPQAASADADGWFVAALERGEAAYWLFDLGRGYAGQGWVEIAGASGAERVAISYVDKLASPSITEPKVFTTKTPTHAGARKVHVSPSSLRDFVVKQPGFGELDVLMGDPAAEPVISDPQTYCRVRMTDRFRLRPGDQVAEPFGLRGGRFLLIQLVGPTGGALRLRPRARVSEYPLEVARELRVEDPLLRKVVALCENTFRACLADGFVDCTWRESSQWVGDALPQALTMSAMADDTRPLRRAIELAAQGAYPDGVLPGVVPGEVHAYTVVDYNFMWVELLRLYYSLTGDRAFVASMWPTLAALLDRFHRDLNGDGLLISQPGRRLFLDWAPLSRGEPSAVYNLHYLLALRAAIALAEEINPQGAFSNQQHTKTPRFQRNTSSENERAMTDESACLGAVVVNASAIDQVVAWRERADELRAAARAAFRQDGRWHDDRERATFSQLAAALALLAGAAEPGEAPALLDAIAARSLDPSDEPMPGRMVLASPFMHHYIFEALRAGGRSDAVVEIVRLRWGRWAAAGCPTTWENWSVDFPDGSQCHAFSAHPRYHLAEIARARGGL